jgi:hypothetical protein
MLRLGLLAVVLATLAACGGSRAEDDGAADSATAPGAGKGVALDGETLDGARLSLADLRGKPVFVNVWASW